MVWSNRVDYPPEFLILVKASCTTNSCDRSDKYPKLAPILKQIGTFEFYNYYGKSGEDGGYPTDFFTVPELSNNMRHLKIYGELKNAM
ncbi:hypothetical protein AB0756_22430 [Tolypothrix campylonemoides VB511288_2]|uniref:Uncharacterized protein n=4 Tax=Cyanophyceae TaxID=3028117 RepID=A0A0C1QW10_9CYAN|nr:hypothetical protein [Tolypothrix bouteillei]KAF3888533.1 hypothetical protein DA73_0400025935 [Tolypothrix bouteillei VB521301]